MKFLRKINLEINKDLYNPIQVKQGDNSRYLLFNLLDNGVPFSLENKTVRVYGLKPDGTKVFNNLTIINAARGLAELQLTTQMLVKPGCLKLELVIYEATDILSTTKFDIDIISCIRDDGAIESTNEFSALTVALAKADEYGEALKQGTENIELIYATELNGVKSSLEESKILINTVNTNKADKVEVESSINGLKEINDLIYAKKTEVTNCLTPKGNSTFSELPISDNNVGDFYYCSDGDGTNGSGNYVWNGTEWYFGGTGDEGYSQLKGNVDDVVLRMNNIYPYIKIFSSQGYINTSGQLVDNANTKCKYTNKILCEEGDVFNYQGKAEYSTVSWLFYKDNDLISYGQISGMAQVIIPNGVNYVVFSSYTEISKSNNVILNVKKVNTDDNFANYYKEKLDINNKINVLTSPNMINPNKLTKGYISINTGEINEDNNYLTTDFLRVKPNTNYLKHANPNALGTSFDKICVYTLDKVFIKTIVATSLDDTNEWLTFNSGPIDGYVRMSTSLPMNDINNFYFGEGNLILSNIPKYYRRIEEGTTVPYSQIEDIPKDTVNHNPLNGKIWYAIGDSSTEGDFDSIIQPNLEWGLYKGQKPVYPFFIGNRTGMIVHNLAKCGGVIATIDDQPNRYQFSKDGVYNAIVGKDADYITIWLGANDMWQHVPIGTINDTDTHTFYGAWNTLLDYYSRNYPKAKLGVVVSYWCSKEYAEAVIKVSAKYGVPTLNLYNDPSLPVTVGSQRPDVSATVKEYRNKQWVVSETNSHASAEYHEIESYFIENWLKGL